MLGSNVTPAFVAASTAARTPALSSLAIPSLMIVNNGFPPPPAGGGDEIPSVGTAGVGSEGADDGGIDIPCAGNVGLGCVCAVAGNIDIP